MSRWVKVVAGMVAVFALGAQSAGGADYAQTARNIIPSGQYGLPGPGADTQAQMYDGLTPLFDQVTNADLSTYFKSERFGIDTDGPGTNESVPRPGVTITRDSFNVPHVNSTTYDGGIWAAGWLAAEDRGLLLQQARFNGRVAAIDAPGLNAINLIAGLQNFQPSAQTEAEVAKQTQVLQNAGPEGVAVLNDIDTFISGINDYLDIHSPSTPDWTRNDVYALNAVKGQFVGQGGGDEARRSQFLGGLQQRLGKKRGLSVFNDLRQFKNDGSPTSVDGNFPYGGIPADPRGSAVLDPGSFDSTPAMAEQDLPARVVEQPAHASNELMIDAKHSATGRPLLVGGPQIGYFFPGFTYEIDMHAPGLQWRGATSAPFPGYMLIGRGADFANTLTSSSGDIIDQYAETLCGGSDVKYRYKGQCRTMGTFNAGTLNGDPVTFRTTVHGPVIGYATTDGRKVAISSKRSSYGKDTLDQLFFRRLSTGRVRDPQSFFNAAALTPQTFNSFYIDHKHIAEFTSGRMPVRPPHVDPGLPTVGTGQYEWRGFIGQSRHIQGIDPRKGTIVNWNNIAAHGFGAADDNWGGNGSAARVDLLNRNLRLEQSSQGKWTLASVTSAMNAAATQDVRAIDTVPLLARLLKGSAAPNQQSQRMLSIMIGWRQRGGSRLDKDLDGEIDDPGAAIMDTAWPRIADAFMKPQLGTQLGELNSLFSRFSQPPGGQYDGWYQYFDRDIGRMLGERVPDPLQNRYCGGGVKSVCRQAVWNAIKAAGVELTADQGSNPYAWRADATAERIHFAPGLLSTTMRYTNRPSGIQQVISFNGHR
jgi:acyl-homoserine lactone acylase PvdQ